jgi:O-antigen ligase
VENILPPGRRRRLLQGIVIALMALATAALLIRKEAGTAWFAIVFVLILLAALMFLQARDKT